MTVITKTSTTTTTYIVIKDHIAYEQALHIMTRVSFRKSRLLQMESSLTGKRLQRWSLK